MYDYIMLRTQISLTAEDRRLLDEKAALTGRSISALIRDAVSATYGSARDASADIRSLDAGVGAWQERETDGETYVEGLRSASRWESQAR